MSIKIWDTDRCYFSDLAPECQACVLNNENKEQTLVCPISQEDCRQIHQVAHNTNVFYCEKCSIIKNKKRFQERYSLILSNVPFFKNLILAASKQAADVERERYSQVVHNLKSLNAQSLLIQYSLIPQEENDSYRDLFGLVEDIVRTHPKEATLTLLKLAKNNAHMKTEFSTHEKLSLETPMLFKQKHIVKSVILNVYHSFDVDFKENSIQLVISESPAKAYFDYETIRVALYHIFFNAVKYIKTHSILNVGITEEDTFICIEFIMESLHIYPDEIDLIFQDHYSGRIATANTLAGKGLGMGIIRKAINLNGGKFEVISGKSAKKSNGKLFSNNIFRIILPKA